MKKLFITFVIVIIAAVAQSQNRVDTRGGHAYVLADKIKSKGWGNDSYTKLLLHCDGTNTSTTMIDSSASNYTVTVVGTAQLDTSQKKFGTASLLLDGNSDYVTVPDSTDWHFGSGDFTIDLWGYLNIPMGTQVSRIINQGGGTYGWSTNGFEWALQLSSDSNMYFQVTDGAGGLAVNLGATVDVDGGWHHFAAVRYGNIYSIYLDGVSKNSVAITNTIPTIIYGTPRLDIGNYFARANQFWNGWIDEPRVSKGIARWTGNFTPPTRSYGE